MNSKQIFFSMILLTTMSNNTFTMDDGKNDEFCKMTCHRPSGYWQVRNRNAFKETSKENQREPWHQITEYVAEPICTASTIPFFMAANALKKSHPLSAIALALAGSASATSHAIPFQFLNDIDQIAAWAATAAVGYDANLYTISGLTSALHNPYTLAALLAVGTAKITDMWIARSKQIVAKSRGLLPKKMIVERKPEHTMIHVMWHLVAAWAAYALLTASF
jgi:hypothetical protein